LLVKHGANHISTEYANGAPTGLRWSMVLYNQTVWFQLPVKVDPVAKLLYRKCRTQHSRAAVPAQATRVAWRQLLRWVQVQLAMIQLGMVEFAQVFLAYMQESERGETVWNALRESRFKQIEAPKPQ
jgi:hypothetical protein